MSCGWHQIKTNLEHVLKVNKNTCSDDPNNLHFISLLNLKISKEDDYYASNFNDQLNNTHSILLIQQIESNVFKNINIRQWLLRGHS